MKNSLRGGKGRRGTEGSTASRIIYSETGKGRLEAFSDGVIAILITIMVLELKVPHGETLRALAPLLPVFLSYVLSFVYLGIYWNNHHHMLHAVQPRDRADALGQPAPVVLAVAVSVRHGLDGREPLRRRAHGALRRRAADGRDRLLHPAAAIIAPQGQDSILAKAIGRDWKGKLSPVLYAIAIVAAFRSQWISQAIYVVVALIWLMPDRRIERTLGDRAAGFSGRGAPAPASGTGVPGRPATGRWRRTRGRSTAC